MYPITKHFQKGDLVQFDLEQDKYCYKSYGADVIMEVERYDNAGWCIIRYVRNVSNKNDVNRLNGHPDRILKLYAPRNHFNEELFTL